MKQTKQYFLAASDTALKADWANWVADRPELESKAKISTADHGCSDVLVYPPAIEEFEAMLEAKQIGPDTLAMDFAPFDTSEAAKPGLLSRVAKRLFNK